MITLLASIAGFISSLVPEVLKLFIDRFDKRHELEIMDRQISMSKEGISARLEEITGYADIVETKALYATFKSGIVWIDALNSLVRPLLAYSFFALYAVIKYFEFEMVAKITEDPRVIIDALWNVDDQAIFAGIISFYFGHRALSKRVNFKR